MAIYLLHFDRPLAHASHYLGYLDLSRRDLQTALDSRLIYHRSGRGSKFLWTVQQAGITFSVARIWDAGTRADETRLKKHGKARICPACSGEAAWGRGQLLGNRNQIPISCCTAPPNPLDFKSPFALGD